MFLQTLPAFRFANNQSQTHKASSLNPQQQTDFALTPLPTDSFIASSKARSGVGHDWGTYYLVLQQETVTLRGEEFIKTFKLPEARQYIESVLGELSKLLKQIDERNAHPNYKKNTLTRLKGFKDEAKINWGCLEDLEPIIDKLQVLRTLLKSIQKEPR
jgi:hypothetical protein